MTKTTPYKITINHCGTIHTYVCYWPTAGIMSDTRIPLSVEDCDLVVIAIESGEYETAILYDKVTVYRSFNHTITVSLF
jgi:hypothetical protein